MVLNLPGIGNMFPHSREFDQGIGTRGIRKGAATFVVALDGSGDFDNIQDAIDSLSSTGGSVYIKEGIYNINSQINITGNGVYIKGSGYSTVLQDQNTDAISRTISVTGDYCQIESLRFVGNAEGYHAVVLEASTSSRVVDCWIDNYSSVAIAQITSGINNIVTGNFITSCGYGIYGDSLTGGLIINNDCNGSSNSNIYISNSSNLKIVGNTSDDSTGGYGIYFDGSSCVAGNNICNSNSSAGIKLDGVGHICSNNRCNSNGSDGIQIVESMNSSVLSNSCDNNMGNGIQAVGRFVDDLIRYSISGNHCYSNDNHGIFLLTGNYSTVENNTCSVNEKGGITLDYSQHNSINGNICMNNDQEGGGNSGIQLRTYGGSHTTYNSITGNNCFDDQGTSTQDYGISEDDANQDYNTIVSNICTGNTTGQINKNGANTELAHNITT